MDRYGPQIEADLHAEFGLDLLDFFRGRHSWGKLYRLLGQFSSTSRYITAQRADDEYVAQLAEAGVDFTKPGEMTEDEYGPVEAKLDNITDAVNALRHVVLQITGNKPGRFEQVERPTNAIKKYMEKSRVRRHDELLDEVAQARDRRRSRTG